MELNFLDMASLLGGLALLMAAGEALIRGAVLLARRFGISPLIVGLTIVGFGTSSPELVVSVLAAAQGAPGLAIGNVVGSNMANMMLILGGAALLFPLTVHRDALRRDGLVMLGATAAFVAIGQAGTAVAAHGAVMVTALVLYMLGSVWADRRTQQGATAALHHDEADEFGLGVPDSGWSIALAIAGGIGGLAAGAHFAVAGASGVARDMGISEEVIGLSIVAVGTSLPELAAALSAARRRHADVCVGNVIGSNIFNMLGIAGAAALTAPLPFSAAMADFDLWALLGVSLVLMGFMLTGRRIARWEGMVLLALYAAYIGWRLAGTSAA